MTPTFWLLFTAGMIAGYTVWFLCGSVHRRLRRLARLSKRVKAARVDMRYIREAVQNDKAR